MRLSLSSASMVALLCALPLLSACDQLGELLDLPDPKKAEAEGRAVGSACRHAGRSLEDCYLLNPGAQKAAVFAGWRDMNDYMMEHKLEIVPSMLPHRPPTQPVSPAVPDAAGAARPPAH